MDIVELDVDDVLDTVAEIAVLWLPLCSGRLVERDGDQRRDREKYYSFHLAASPQQCSRWIGARIAPGGEPSDGVLPIAVTNIAGS